MELKKYKLKPITGETTDLNSDFWSIHNGNIEEIPCEIRIRGTMDNRIMFSHKEEPQSIYELPITSKDIRYFVKWQMGQDEYLENQRKHEEKHTITRCLEDFAGKKSRTDKDIENQKIVDEIKKLNHQVIPMDIVDRPLPDSQMRHAIYYCKIAEMVKKATGKEIAEL